MQQTQIEEITEPSFNSNPSPFFFAESFIPRYTEMLIKRAFAVAKQKFPNVIRNSVDRKIQEANSFLDIILLPIPEKKSHVLQLLREGKNKEAEAFIVSSLKEAELQITDPSEKQYFKFGQLMLSSEISTMLNVVSCAQNTESFEYMFTTFIKPFRQRVNDYVEKLLITTESLNLDSDTIVYIKKLLATKITAILGNSHGVCGEFTSAVFCSLTQDQTVPIPVEIVRVLYLEKRVPKGDHVLVVCNKEGDSLSPASWGSNCYVCDPLANSFYQSCNLPEDSILTYALRYPENYEISFLLKNIPPASAEPQLKTLAADIIQAKIIKDLVVSLKKYVAEMQQTNIIQPT